MSKQKTAKLPNIVFTAYRRRTLAGGDVGEVFCVASTHFIDKLSTMHSVFSVSSELCSPLFLLPERKRLQRVEEAGRREQAENGEVPDHDGNALQEEAGGVGEEAGGADGGEGGENTAVCRHLKFVKPNNVRKALQRLKNKKFRCEVRAAPFFCIVNRFE